MKQYRREWQETDYEGKELWSDSLNAWYPHFLGSSSSSQVCLFLTTVLMCVRRGGSRITCVLPPRFWDGMQL